jgi:hypothetical protein
MLCITAVVSHADAPKKILQDDWYGVFIGSMRIGYQHTELSRTNLNGKAVYRDENVFSMKIAAGSAGMEVHSEDVDFFSMGMLPLQGSSRSAMNGTVVKSSSVTAKYLYMGEAAEWEGVCDGKHFSGRVRVPSKKLLVKGVEGTLKPSLLRVGEKIVDLPDFVPAFGNDPFAKMGKVSTETVVKFEDMDVLGNKCRAFLVKREKFSGWEREDGSPIKVDMNGVTLTFQKETKEEALANVTPIPTSLAVTSDRKISASGLVKELQVRIVGINDRDMCKSDARQSAVYQPERNAIEYHITAEDFDPAKSLSRPMTMQAYRPWLKAETGIESNRPEIGELALSIAGSEDNAYLSACKLRAWVYGNLESKDNSGVPVSAIDVLKAKKGDCKHHAVLFAALARSIGIPTRLVKGIVWGDGSFGGHEWAECYVGEWVSFDPSWSCDFVDATHIRLFTTESTDDQIATAMVRFLTGPNPPRAEIIDVKYVDYSDVMSTCRDHDDSALIIGGMKILCDKSLPLVKWTGSGCKYALGICPHGVLFKFPADHVPVGDICKLHGDFGMGTVVAIDENGKIKAYPHGMQLPAVADVMKAPTYEDLVFDTWVAFNKPAPDETPKYAETSAVFSSSLTIDASVTFNDHAEFNSVVVFKSPVKFNDYAEFNSPVVFKSPVSFNDDTVFNVPMTFDVPATFNSSVTFNAPPTFNVPATFNCRSVKYSYQATTGK